MGIITKKNKGAGVIGYSSLLSNDLGLANNTTVVRKLPAYNVILLFCTKKDTRAGSGLFFLPDSCFGPLFLARFGSGK